MWQKRLIFLTVFLSFASQRSIAQIVAEPTSSPSEAPYSSFAVTVKGGATVFSGDLTANKKAYYDGFSLVSFFQRTNFPLMAYIGMDVSDINGATSKASEFPFNDDRSLTMASVIFPAVGVCFPLLSRSLKPCFGGGLGAIAIRDKDGNDQTYGSTILNLSTAYTLDSGLQLGIESRYFNVSGRRNNINAEFAALSYGLTAGWEFR